jgi:hypothetical protein
MLWRSHQPFISRYLLHIIICLTTILKSKSFFYSTTETENIALHDSYSGFDFVLFNDVISSAFVI